jgi:hypothetical protein
MRAALLRLLAWIFAPPRWPRVILGATGVAALLAWSLALDGAVGRDWAYWASSSGAVVDFIVVALLRNAPAP